MTENLNKIGNVDICQDYKLRRELDKYFFDSDLPPDYVWYVKLYM